MLQDVISTFTRMKRYKFTGETIHCDLCGSVERDIVGRRDRYGNPLQTCLCRGCGLVFTSPMPTDLEVDNFYRRFYRKSYHNAYKPTAKALLRAERGAASRCEAVRPALKSGARVLDVGSASGNFVRFMADQGYDSMGIEPNRGFAEYSRTENGINVQATIWQEAEIEDGSIDVITANHVVEHFRSPVAALQTFHRWLKPGGAVYISVPNVYNPDRTPYGRFHFAHVYNFTRETLIMLALKSGFEMSEDYPGDSTNILFFRRDVPVEDWQIYPDVYTKLKTYFATYTNRRYFFSAKPYARWVHRMRKLGGDMIKVKVAS